MPRTAIGSGLAFVVAALAACLAAGPAHSASDARTEKAREHYLQADAFYKLDRYASALQEYEQAYLAKPDPSFLYNIAQCHRLMGDKAEALKFYRRYLKDAPNAANREVAEKHIKDLETALAAPPVAPPVTAPAASSAPAAGAAAPPPPLGRAAPSMPAPVETVSPTAAPQRTGNALALAAPPPAASAEASGGALAAGPVPSREEGDRPIYTKWWFWTGVGAVVAGGLIIALSAKSDPSCPAGRTCQ